MAGLERSVYCAACKAWIEEADLESHLAANPSHALLRYHHGGKATPPTGRLDDIVAFCMGRNSGTVTDVYLQGAGGVPANLSGFVVPLDAQIIGMSAACETNASWVAEVRRNGTATVLASLTFSSSRKEYEVFSAPVDIDAGDELQVYCNGTGVPYPYVTVFLKPVYRSRGLPPS